MPGAKRQRSPSPVAFARPPSHEASNRSFGNDPLSNSFINIGPGFSCGTPTMGPMPPGRSQPAAPIFRLSPHVTASNGMFNSPLFSVRTPVLDYQSTPPVFASAYPSNSYGPGGSHNGQQSLLMSPMPFMDSPATPMPSHDLQNSLSLDAVPGLSLNAPQSQSSVLERFKKFFDNQRGAEDSVAHQFQHQAMNPSLTAHNHKAGIMPLDDDEEDDVSSAEISADSPLLVGAETEFAEASLRPGSSCHQCKSRRTHGLLSHCAGGAKRKTCRKKYCDQCLTKFYQMQSSRHKSNRDRKWSCPSCQGLCCCAACRRSKLKKQDMIRGNVVHSPATSLAVGLVMFGDIDLLSLDYFDKPPSQQTPVSQ